MASDGAAVRLVVGLGNPGARYERTRHNAGFWFVDALGGRLRAERKFHGEAGRASIDGVELALLKPQTYMNHSGRAVQAYANFFRIPAEQILVVHDEIDLPPGGVRLKKGGGHGGHNGLRDIVAALGTPAFARLRLGVGHPGSSEQVVPYVLSVAPRQEQAAIEAGIDAALQVLPWLARGEWDRAFQRLHTAADRASE